MATHMDNRLSNFLWEFDTPNAGFEALLALSLSEPRRTTVSARQPRVLVSDETIVESIMMLREYRLRVNAPLSAESVRVPRYWPDDHLAEIEHKFATEFLGEARRVAAVELGEEAPHSEGPTFEAFRQSHIEEFSDIQRRLLELEDRGYIIDPFGTLTLIVLSGLIPLRVSVRTPKGEAALREIDIDAAFWTYNRTPMAWTLNIRAVRFVRQLLGKVAEEYLNSEDTIRRRKGRPRISRGKRAELPPSTSASDETADVPTAKLRNKT